MLACHEPIRVFIEDYIGSMEAMSDSAPHQTVIVDTNEIVGLVGIVYRGDKACRDLLYVILSA